MIKSFRPRKNLDLESLLGDFGIEYQTSGTGWIQLPCPFCYKGDGKFGLGWSGTVFNCFRCGKLGRLETLSALLNLTPAKTAQTLSKYERDTKGLPDRFNAVKRDLGGVSAVKMPYGATKMVDRHREYLKARRFDPNRLEAEWGLLGTGPVGPFAHRIIIPVFQDGKLVSFQGRDITGKAANKYKSCPDDKAVLPIKSCLYGWDKVQGDSVIVTEGPTKVWRLGAGAVCTFGAMATDQQVKILTRFRRLFTLFDEDEAGREGADKLSRRLAVLGSHCCIVTVGVKDVAELSDEDAKALMQELIK